MHVPRWIDTVVRTCLAVLVLPAGLILHSIAAAAVALRGGSNREVHRVYVAFGRLCLRVGGTDLRVHGLDHIEPDRAYVIVPNHESNWDPPCLMAGLSQLVIRFIVKQEIMRIPIFGQALRVTGNVLVVRSRSPSDVERIRRGMQERGPEVSILFFAEGHRTRTGAMQPFKMGAFATALQHAVPILPVAIAGTYPIWTANRLRIRKGHAVIEVGEPIPVESSASDDRAALRDQTYEAVLKLRARARQRLRDRGFEPGGID